MGRVMVGLVATCALIVMVPALAAAAAKVGERAPEFTLKDGEGKEYSLAAAKGKYIVLEWVNFDCPFVGKHYGSGNMQQLQKTYTGKGVIWFSVCSSAPGTQGHFESADLKERMEEVKAAPTAYLVDESGTVGRMYGAKTTPHMFVIDPEGTLIYAGGIDDMASTKLDDVPKAKNYVRLVLDAAMSGKEVPLTESRPYGCSVKYR
jgi:peroxiredoxin